MIQIVLRVITCLDSPGRAASVTGLRYGCRRGARGCVFDCEAAAANRVIIGRIFHNVSTHRATGANLTTGMADTADTGVFFTLREVRRDSGPYTQRIAGFRGGGFQRAALHRGGAVPRTTKLCSQVLADGVSYKLFVGRALTGGGSMCPGRGFTGCCTGATSPAPASDVQIMEVRRSDHVAWCLAQTYTARFAFSAESKSHARGR